MSLHLRPQQGALCRHHSSEARLLKLRNARSGLAPSPRCSVFGSCHTQSGTRHQRDSLLRMAAASSAASSIEASSTQAATAATAPATAAEAEVSQPNLEAAASVSDPWQHLMELQATGQPVECTVTAYNKGGVLVLVEGLKGFIPYSKLDRSRLKQGHQGDLDYLIGTKVTAQVIQLDVQAVRKEVVLSELQAAASQSLRKLKRGDVVTATVTRLQDYGAFVVVQPPEGGTPVQGLVHTSELSWGKIMSVNSVVSVGETVRLVVLDADPIRGRLSLSLRRLQRDPLKQNIDTMMPSGEEAVEWKEALSAPLQLFPIIQRLKSLDGVEDVSLGRQAQVLSTVAPEMQVFLSREQREDGIVVVTRTGPLLQELLLVTSLTRAQVKQQLQKIMDPQTEPKPAPKLAPEAETTSSNSSGVPGDAAENTVGVKAQE